MRTNIHIIEATPTTSWHHHFPSQSAFATVGLTMLTDEPLVESYTDDS
jgi:hypothetical protein